MPIRSQMSSIMEQNEPEGPELFVLEFRKIAESDFFYILASTNINQSSPNLVNIYNVCEHKISDEFNYGFNRTITELFALEFEKNC